MLYVYHDLSVAGWIAFATLFAFLGGFTWARRLARRDASGAANRKDEQII